MNITKDEFGYEIQDTLENNKIVAGYIRKVARIGLCSIKRKRAKQQQLTSLDDKNLRLELSIPQIDLLELTICKAKVAVINRTFQKDFTKPMQEVFALYYFKDWSVQEIAERKNLVDRRVIAILKTCKGIIDMNLRNEGFADEN